MTELILGAAQRGLRASSTLAEPASSNWPARRRETLTPGSFSQCVEAVSSLIRVSFVSPARSLDIPALELTHQVIAGADAQGHDRQCGILAGGGDKPRPVHDE